ncbi:hypothetical protein AGDE_12969 [Angomonas deanei]|uniref:Uncharacterized protein n=1 Tax=Angomonas deanei TaxID=59799 RepID=A0A7G2CKQ4_9TRYP|nr:hypothetical protein AGDE_12969 [Angomonas deanei]CAD2218792.1 hypothetical protein, conserved [Angomonas deanei]|eukprot:EPY23256.1 hypothetical protein AGDE_12969 [Angomonas deanei]
MLIQDVAAEDPETRATRLRQMNATSGEGPIHAGTVTRLTMTLSDSIQQRSAELQLEKASVLLLVEKAMKLAAELQSAMMEATRSIYSCTSFLAEKEEEAPIPITHTSAAGMLDSLLSRTDLRESEGARALTTELEWSSDVLKATYRGIGEVVELLKKSVDQLATSTPLVQPADRPDRLATRVTALGTSAELERLLGGLVNSLRELKSRGQRQQDQLVRRLSHELQSHYESAKQYEQRIRALEEENTRLLTSMKLPSAGQPQTYDEEAPQPYPSSVSEGATSPEDFIIYTQNTPEKRFHASSRREGTAPDSQTANPTTYPKPSVKTNHHNNSSNTLTLEEVSDIKKRPSAVASKTRTSPPRRRSPVRKPSPTKPPARARYYPRGTRASSDDDSLTFPYKEGRSIWRTPERHRAATTVESPSPRGPLPHRSSPSKALRSPRNDSPLETATIPSSWRNHNTSVYSSRPLLSPAR